MLALFQRFARLTGARTFGEVLVHYAAQGQKQGLEQNGAEHHCAQHGSVRAGSLASAIGLEFLVLIPQYFVYLVGLSFEMLAPPPPSPVEARQAESANDRRTAQCEPCQPGDRCCSNGRRVVLREDGVHHRS